MSSPYRTSMLLTCSSSLFLSRCSALEIASKPHDFGVEKDNVFGFDKLTKQMTHPQQSRNGQLNTMLEKDGKKLKIRQITTASPKVIKIMSNPTGKCRTFIPLREKDLGHDLENPDDHQIVKKKVVISWKTPRKGPAPPKSLKKLGKLLGDDELEEQEVVKKPKTSTAEKQTECVICLNLLTEDPEKEDSLDDNIFKPKEIGDLEDLDEKDLVEGSMHDFEEQKVIPLTGDGQNPSFHRGGDVKNQLATTQVIVAKVSKLPEGGQEDFLGKQGQNGMNCYKIDIGNMSNKVCIEAKNLEDSTRRKVVPGLEMLGQGIEYKQTLQDVELEGLDKPEEKKSLTVVIDCKGFDDDRMGHEFHRFCITTYVNSNWPRNNQCPICRTEFDNTEFAKDPTEAELQSINAVVVQNPAGVSNKGLIAICFAVLFFLAALKGAVWILTGE